MTPTKATGHEAVGSGTKKWSLPSARESRSRPHRILSRSMTQPDNQLHRFRNAFPNGHLLAPGDAGAANAVLEQAGLSDLTPVESVTPAGQGNMNLVLRVTGPSSTAILKQARPWVEKYPDIEAPAERAAVEAAFYRTIGQDPVAARAMPRLLGEAPESGAVVLEDLGRSEPLDTCYDGDPLDNETLAAVCRYAARLHTLEPANPILRNHAMRALNHAHIFALPLHRESGPDLDAITPGLQEAADELRKDHAFTNAVTSLGGQYLDDGPNLLHGDLHAGSIHQTRLTDHRPGIPPPRPARSRVRHHHRPRRALGKKTRTRTRHRHRTRRPIPRPRRHPALRGRRDHAPPRRRRPTPARSRPPHKDRMARPIATMGHPMTTSE